MNVIKRNLGWLLLSQSATWVSSVTLLLVAPRQLGDYAFGRLSFAIVYVGFFELFSLFGTGTFLIKVVSRDSALVARYVANTVVMKLLLTLLLIGVALALAVALGYDREVVLLIFAYCIGMLFNALNNAVTGSLQGMQKMGRPAMLEVARAYVGSTLALIVLMSGGSLLAYALTFNFACAIPLLANAAYIRPSLGPNRDIDPRLWKEIMAGGFPFFILSALVTFYAMIDVPLLESFSGSDTVGWYSLAYRWVSMPAFLAVSVSTAFFPTLSAQSVHVPEFFARTANRALHLVVLLATPAALGIALIAGDFINTFYGSEFHQSVPLMRILALHIPLVAIDIVLGSVAIASDRQRRWVIVAVIAAIFNPLVNIAAIPVADRLYGNGAIGAATVTVLTEVILTIGALRLRPAGVLDRATGRLLLRIGAASLTMLPVVLLLGAAPLPVKIVAGAATYGLASLALGTISTHDIRSLRTGAIGRSRQPTVAR
jgi:O-antigen/teichoic acid export membrane protein